jgi:RimJ/RimL family protein N-acetyltransferase
MTEALIRPAREDDAPQLLALLRGMAAEPDIDLPWDETDFPLTEDRVRSLVQRTSDSDTSLYLVAEAAGEIVGELSLVGGRLKADAHAATLGMSVHRDWRGRGVGKALMHEAMRWAKANPALKRVELKVYSTNDRAIALYRRFGFEIEGTRRLAINKRGQLIDDYVMGLLLEA